MTAALEHCGGRALAPVPEPRPSYSRASAFETAHWLDEFAKAYLKPSDPALRLVQKATDMLRDQAVELEQLRKVEAQASDAQGDPAMAPLVRP